MKVKVSVMREIEIEVGDAVSQLAEWYETQSVSQWQYVPNSLIQQAIEEVEKVTGLPFGDSSAESTITAVCDMDGEAILEW